MAIFDCIGMFISANGQQQEVKITTDCGSLLIRIIPSETQIVYLPAGSMDTILIWERVINDEMQMGTLDLDNPETQIKVTFYLSLNDLKELRQQLRGKQVFYRQHNQRVISQITPNIQLIQTENQVLVQKVALFPQSLSDTPRISGLGQLKQEADILNQLKEHPHKNIIQMEEITTNYQSVSILLENCEGGDLLKILNNKNICLDIPVVMECLLSGLEHLHKINIVHRDIKLQNILFKDAKNSMTVKIADFGLSCQKEQIPFYNPRCGTPGYTAPEVFAQRCSYDEKVDIYSAGIILYNMLTKKNPFGNSKNIQDIIKQNITGEYNQSHLQMTKLNDPLAYDLLTKMLQKDSTLRPSASECLKHPYFKQEEQEDEEEEIKEVLPIKKSSKITKRVKI